MELKQSTLEAIVDTERDLVLKASAAYGQTFDTAHALTALFSTQIVSVDPEKFVFVAFHGQIKKHLILALLSAVRRHSVQAGMNMRQVLEAGAWAAYAMAHKETANFCETTPEGYVNVPKRLEKARNAWIERHYQTRSIEIQRLKTHINRSSAHASIIYAVATFQMRGIEDPGFETPIFDLEHTNQVRSDIWFVGNTAIGLMDLFRTINQNEKVFQEATDFDAAFRVRVRESDQQRMEMMNRPEYMKTKGPFDTASPKSPSSPSAQSADQ